MKHFNQVTITGEITQPVSFQKRKNTDDLVVTLNTVPFKDDAFDVTVIYQGLVNQYVTDTLVPGAVVCFGGTLHGDANGEIIVKSNNLAIVKYAKTEGEGANGNYNNGGQQKRFAPQARPAESQYNRTENARPQARVPSRRPAANPPEEWEDAN